MKYKSRNVVVYTPSYAVVPYRVVHDTSDPKAPQTDILDVAEEWDKKPAEDSSTKVYRVGVRISNRQLLTALNGSMEIATKRDIRMWDETLKANNSIGKKLKRWFRRFIRQ